MIEALDHVQLAMPSGGEDQARAFYSDLLGIPEVPKPPHLAKRGGCWFERGPLKVHLGVEMDFRPARKAHPAFRVADLAFLTKRLAEAGLGHLPVIVGGIIPDEDAVALSRMGVARVYTPKDFQLNTIMRDIVTLVEPAEAVA